MKYTDSHEWLCTTNDQGTIGITAFARKELGDIVYIELPRLGMQISAKQEVAVVESTKAAADIYCPVDGVIVEVNQALKEDISLINTSPETDGWIFKIKITNPMQLEALLDKTGYEALIS